MNYVESFNLLGLEAKQIPCIKGEGAPTTATEGAVGCFYMDTITGTLYKCTVVLDEVYIWTTFEGQKGDPGVDGITPHIGNNGNWWIGDTDTGKIAVSLAEGAVVVPTIGDSETSVMSQKATTEAITKINNTIGYVKEVLDDDYINNSAIKYADGTVHTGYTISQENKHTDFIKVSKGVSILYDLRTEASCCIIAFYTNNTNDTYVADMSVAGTGGGISGEYTVLQDGYIIISTKTSYANNSCIIKKEGIKTEFDNLEEATEEVKTITEKILKETFNMYSCVSDNAFINAKGMLSTHEYYRTTEFIPVTQGDEIKYKIAHATELPIISLYAKKDSSTFIEGINGKVGYTEGVYVVPQDGFVRFSWYHTGVDGYVTFTDLIPSNVEHYIKNTVSVNGATNLNVLCLGDSILGHDSEIVKFLGEFSGANILNGAVGGTSVSPRVSETDSYLPFDGENLVRAIASRDFTAQNAVKSKMVTRIQNRLEMLEALDMSTIDLIILAYGTNDYTQGKTIEAIETSLGNCIDMIQSAYPTIKILVVTPTWRIFSLTENGDNKVYNVSTLKEITEAIEIFCKNKRISVLNSYQNMPLSIATVPTYMDDITMEGDTDSQTGIEIPSGSGRYYDGVHFNEFGNKMYAHLINGKIQSLY